MKGAKQRHDVGEMAQDSLAQRATRMKKQVSSRNTVMRYVVGPDRLDDDFQLRVEAEESGPIVASEAPPSNSFLPLFHIADLVRVERPTQSRRRGVETTEVAL